MAHRGKNGRPDYGHRWRKLAARVRRHHSVCGICGEPIDKTLHHEDPMSFTVDHVEPVSRRPDLALVWSNVTAAHRKCNRDKGASSTLPATENDVTSREW